VAETLYIQRDDLRTRVLLCRDGEPIELRIESSRGRSLSGNIYRGRVERIAAEMDAAFVDLGLARMGMLPANAVWLKSMAQERPEHAHGEDVPGAPKGRRIKREIGAMLEIGQEVMVQVVREPVAKKGPRVTMFVSLPGKNLLLLGREPHIGVSKRIDQPEERQRLRNFVGRLLPRDCGAVIRTVGENATEAELVNDIAFLRAQWEDVQQRFSITSAPSFLFHDADLVRIALRDLVTPATEEVWLDAGIDQRLVSTWLATLHPEARPVVRVHDGADDLFAHHNLDGALSSVIATKVALAGGGDVVIDRAEAGTVIDVNAGKRIGNEKLEDAVLRLNLAAAKLIARQLRLRNIGGLVIIDFVDMSHPDDRRMLDAVLESEMSDDPARVRLARVNRFGLVVLTRKRERESVYVRMTETCPTCDGRGYVRSAGDLAVDSLARLRRALVQTDVAGSIVKVSVPARVASVLNEQLADVLRDIEGMHRVTIEVQARQDNDDRTAELDVRSGG
jgi:ribonuclease G